MTVNVTSVTRQGTEQTSALKITMEQAKVTETTVKTKKGKYSKGNSTTVAKKATRVSTAGRRKKMPTNGRLTINKGKKEWQARITMMRPTLNSY